MSQQGMDELSHLSLMRCQCTRKLDFCEHCMFGKHTHVSFFSGIHTIREFFVIFIQIFRALLVLLSLELTTCWHFWMIFPKNSSSIS